MDNCHYFNKIRKSNELTPILENNMIIYIEEFCNKINEYINNNNIDKNRLISNTQIAKYKKDYINLITSEKKEKIEKAKKIKEREQIRKQRLKLKLAKNKEKKQKLKEQNLKNELLSK